MNSTSRRGLLQAALLASTTSSAAAMNSPHPRGPEGQRLADLGNGFFRNPILAGDHADPTILRDGNDYYMTFSSFMSYPGAVIWHSTDLLNWRPVCAALHKPIGSVWAMDLVRHGERYFLYIPVLSDDGVAIYVIHAPQITGPWSEPIRLDISGHIDPGHVVGEDGKRYLFLNGGKRVRLSDDGLSVEGVPEAAYSHWQYPDDWVVEMVAPEGPKLFRRGEWFYMVAAVGGTAGPPTSHMVTLARSRSIHGPWEHCPHNPIVRTRSASEPWWSRGHASVVQGPAGDWWMVYHGYENGFRTLGRQTLLEPIQWTADGWFRARGGSLAAPLRRPAVRRTRQTEPAWGLSDDFSQPRLGLQWSFHAPGPQDLQRWRHEGGGLVVQGKGSGLPDCSPLTCQPGDRSYEASVEMEIIGEGQGGLALFYNERAFAGIGFNGRQMLTYGQGSEHAWMREDQPARRLRLKVLNQEQVVTWYFAVEDGPWQKHSWQMEVSGLHHNVFGGFMSLRLALFSAGDGAIRWRKFRYRGLS